MAAGGVRAARPCALQSRLRAYSVPVIAFVIFVAIVGQITDFYLSRLAALIAFWAAVGMTWNLIGGYAGQLSLGHAAFVGLGGYVALVLQQEFGIMPWVGLLASTVAAALAALIVGAPTLRLSGIYFSLATLAYPLILQVLFTYWGYQEALIPAHPESPFLFMQWRDNRWYAAIFGTILMFCWLATVFLERSHWRYLLTAVREDEAAASAVGINTWLVKLWAFVISGSIAGMLGVIYAQMLFVVTPETMFGIGVSVQALVVNLVGGVGYAIGPLLGTLIAVPISQALEAQFGSISGAAQLVYGLVLIVVVLTIPRGLIDELQRIDPSRHPTLGKLQAWLTRGTTDVTPPPASGVVAVAANASLAKGEVLLNAEGLGKAYGGVIALRDFNLEIRQHEFIGIVGPNGAGKTTLFDLLTGFQRPTSGRLYLRGENVTRSAPYRLARSGIRRTFQIPRPFGRLSVYENAMLGGLVGATEVAASRMDEATWRPLRAVGLEHLANKPAESLGPSQIRLLEVARALVSRPTLLLLDEPLAGLDASEVHELINILRGQQTEGLTIVLVDHAIGTVAKIVERLVVIDNGILIADGAPVEVTRMPRVIEAYLGSRWDHARD
jgi:ABC-type branched-subunit amino acid transport system ATPase component/ABC-type branched-subunit amino acid transport system permease subunit